MLQFVAIFLLSISPQIAIAQLNPEISARLASLKNEGEGVRVTEDLLRHGDHPGLEIQRRLRAFASRAERYLDASVRRAGWNDSHMGLEGPACFDAAPKFGLLLRGMLLPGYVVANGHHVYLIAETRESVLLIDPTIRQYFGQNSAPDWVPRIFVGTLSELQALYAKEPGLPVLDYQTIYFDPERPPYRRDSKMLSQRGRLLGSPDSMEYSPLTAFFNLANYPLPGNLETNSCR